MLDGVVRALFEVPWSRARRWIADGKITVDGEVVTDGRVRVGAGAVVVFRPELRRLTGAGDLPATALVHVDAHLVVVDKPSGVSTMPYERGERGTLDLLVRRLLSRTERGGKRSGAHPALSVVHRLDKETSGLIVFGRTFLARQRLKAQFRVHSIHRRYLALAHGEVEGGTIRSRLLADRGDGRRGSLASARFGREVRAEEGREAVTHVEPVERLHGATLVGCRLETGRTHQIRIHLAEAGHPLLGERVYGREYAGPWIAAPRVMLHAAELGLEHPATGEPLRWSRRPPGDFWEALERLRR
ncbi:MAG: RluA family pseudouridine synthase [Deltaproteobacteria bacterium]|nr:RluA family pseudouridine synthase [Deltaproteobacteria bacterium]